ncbi:hypothetical protein M409DRAFT_25562 [Zasmidium cellare ATCC 36951]|uniref:mRNA export factor MEX67 n=1 Tax=Zasmidium cellare ATCC 36951 TaxID=1080233 RepID=A0A6A6CDD7_ZASCE|nr:uncharacterized protein M409DRAFT_25562 [Zasmidium cellare ATCC 36951]KAF2164220.1 hypothetical protein M409DRAFT_25562 [Zasmidium cellare ATCC 36951]
MAPSNASERPSRRALGKRRAADRDGDVKMGVESNNRTGIGKTKRPPKGPKGAQGALNSTDMQRKIHRATANGDVRMKGDAPAKTSGGLEEFKVTGWEKSTAAHDPDGGVESLKRWLQGKVSRKLGSASRKAAQFKKSRVEGTALYISVPAIDAGPLARMNGFKWAGVTLTIEKVGGSGQDSKLSSKAEETKLMLRNVLERRYNIQTKLLDLSALSQDDELKAQAIFDSNSTASKFFPAMMKVLELAFDTTDELNAHVESVSLANNGLADLKAVSTLSATLPKLHNLDLSNNNFANLSALSIWRKRFLHLQHLVVSGNPLEQNEPNYAAELVKWYPNLRVLNQIQVRTEEDIKNKASTGNLPFPIRSPIFQDEGQIAENFIRQWFLGFDTDRPQLAQIYYDDQSDFSYAVNVSAPRDPNDTVQTEKSEWSAYIRNSRNLKKISQLPARQNRLFRGPKAISEVFATLPKTKHPDLGAEARKWLIECHMQPGIPDPTGQSPQGVDGFAIYIHSEYDELDDRTGQPNGKKRSCDHSFQIGPGGPQGVRIVSHQITIRAYGGTQALEPEAPPQAGPPSPPQQAAVDIELYAQAGLSLQQAEEICAALSQQTGMTINYCKDCLDQVGWDAPRALAAFEDVKATLPADAFVQNVPVA